MFPASRSSRVTVAALVCVAVAIDLGDLHWFGFTAEWLAVVVASWVTLGVSLVCRRGRPAVALAVAGSGYLVVWTGFVLLPGPMLLPTTAQAAVWVAAFSLIAEGTDRMQVAAVAVLSGCVGLEALENVLWAGAGAAPVTMGLLSAVTSTFVPLVLCAAAFAVRGRIQVATAQASQAERLRELDARSAAHDERLRLARDLHDVVANRLSAVAMRITAAGHVRGGAVTPEGEILDEIGKEIDSALDELRSMLGTLRSDRSEAATAPPPSLADVAELARGSGAEVEVVVEGVPVPLPSVLDLTAYRVLQEALANVTRHARPARATVTVGYGADGVRLRVDDEGTGGGTGGGPKGGPGGGPSAPVGHGIIGMRERAALCGGRVTAGMRPGGGWTVEAFLPLPVLPLSERLP